ncbi:MAG TPA: CotH kinase family protein, partial [Verrucomicrobiales bacterium]|nr:CotH kinase family protein [Verrucomicrobiales bacterium]
SARVDIRKLTPYDNGAETKTGGYIWKVDRLDAGDSGFTAGGQALVYYYPKEVDIEAPQRAPQREYLTNYLHGFNTALNSLAWTDAATGYAAWIDVPAAIDNHLLNLWSYNVDAFRLSTYFHKDAGGKIVPGPVWDFDRALSCATDTRDDNPAAWGNGNWPEGGFFAAFWWERFFKDIDFYQKYIDRWQDLRRAQFSPSSINALIDTTNDAIGTEAVTRDLARWNYAKRAWTSPFTGTAYSGQPAEIQRIKDYLQQRAGYFDTQWVGSVAVTPAAGAVVANTTVTLTGPAGVPVYYTLDGTDPRPAGGGAPAASALLWNGAPLTVSGFTHVMARAYKASHTAATGGTLNPPLVSKWGGLRDLRYFTDDAAAAGNLVITEINFNPVDPTPTEAAAGPAWTNNSFEFLELRNTGPRRVDLTGVQFTNGITYAFPADGTALIEPGAYIILSPDPAAFAVRYGAGPRVFGPWSGNLSNGGETLTLLAADGSVIQSIHYEDSWFPAADKGGATLVVFDAAATVAQLNTSANWRASAVPGGTPGRDDPASLQPGPEGEIIGFVYHPQSAVVSLTFHSRPGKKYSVMTSPDLQGWTTAATGLLSGGNATVFEFAPPPGASRLFMRALSEP